MVGIVPWTINMPQSDTKENFSFKNPIHNSRCMLELQLVKISATCGDGAQALFCFPSFHFYPDLLLMKMNACIHTWLWLRYYSEPHLAQSHPLNQVLLFPLIFPQKGYLSSIRSRQGNDSGQQ